MIRIALVAAVARNGVIGQAGGLPWHISSDLKRFREITMGKPVIMGRKTWESLPRRPLPGRTNIVVTRDRAFLAEGALIAHGPGEAMQIAEAEAPEEIAVIGGGEIYRMFLPRAHRIYLTEVALEATGDTLFPVLDIQDWQEVAREEHPRGPRDTAAFNLRILDRVAEP